MEDIIVEKAERWVEIRINRPDKLNAIREQTAVEILDVMAEAEADRSCTGIILTGIEKAFCTGVDTSEQKDEANAVYELWRRRKRAAVKRGKA